MVECKKGDIEPSDSRQLERYFVSLHDTKFGVLTNGVRYQLYSDKDDRNVMEGQPFFEFDVTDMKDEEIEILRYFHRGIFDINAVGDVVRDRMCATGIKRCILSEMNDPTGDFVRCVARDFVKSFRGPTALKQSEDQMMKLKASAKKAFDSVIADLQPVRRTSVQSVVAALQNTTTDDTASEQPTPEDWEWFYTIRTALVIRCDCKPDSLCLRKIAEGFAIYMDNSQRKPIAHLIVRGGKTHLGLFDDYNTRRLCPYDGVETIFHCILEIMSSVDLHTGKRKRLAKPAQSSPDGETTEIETLNQS